MTNAALEALSQLTEENDLPRGADRLAVLYEWKFGAQRDGEGYGVDLRVLPADEKFALPITLTGQVYGFEQNGEVGNYGAEEFVKAVAPHLAARVKFDSEKGQFFAYPVADGHTAAIPLYEVGDLFERFVRDESN